MSKNVIDEKLKGNIEDYISYLCKNSTIEKPLWNKEVFMGLKQPGWTYIDGCMMVGLDTLYKYNHNKDLLKYIENFVGPLVNDDGYVKILYYNNYNTYTTEGCDSDPCNMAKLLYTLYDETKNEKYRKSIEFFMNEQVRKLPRVLGNFWHKIKYYNQIWLDGLYMIQPFFAEYTKRYEDKMSYYDIVYQLENAFKLTWVKSLRLNVHGYDGQYEDKSKKMIWSDSRNGKSKVVWGRANGWFIMALVDVYEIIDDVFLKQKIAKIIKEVVDGLILYIDPKTKMIWQVVDKIGKEKNYPETSGSLMIAYSIMKAVRLQALDDTYLKYGVDMFKGTCDTYFKEVNGVFTLGGICIGAGLTASRTDKYAGTYDMYVSRKVVDDDGKAVGPFVMAYTEILMLENE